MYRDYAQLLDASNVADVPSPGHVELRLTGDPTGANRLHIFTGIANVGFGPTEDDVLRRGVVRVLLEHTTISPKEFVDATCTSGLASIFNNDDDFTTTWAVDCVTAEPERIVDPLTAREEWRLVLVAAIAVAGGNGHTGLSRLNYQANVRVKVAEASLQALLVRRAGSSDPFGPSADLLSGASWDFQMILDEIPSEPVFVTLRADSALAPVQPAVSLSAAQAEFTAPPTTPFFFGDPVIVTVTASLNGVDRTATLKLINNPR